LLPRPVDGRPITDSVEIDAAQGIRRAAQWNRTHPIPLRLPLRPRAQRGDLRREILEQLEGQIFKRLFDPEDVAGIIIEPIQGEGGYVPAPKFFLQELQRICRQHGIMFIVDEVQSGMGRTGKWWASEHAGIEPDILCSAKGIASGMPLGAIIARESVMRWGPGAHGTTFGGNPVCLAAALATMDLIDSEYKENAHHMGDYLFGRIADWTKNFKIVGDVRGRGLMIGIEIVRDQRTKERAADCVTRSSTWRFTKAC